MNLSLNENDVVTIDDSELSFTQSQTARVREIMKTLVEEHLHDDLGEWGNEGLPCEVLLASGGGWQRGRIKLSLQFIPDAPVAQPNPTDVVMSNS